MAAYVGSPNGLLFLREFSFQLVLSDNGLTDEKIAYFNFTDRFYTREVLEEMAQLKKTT